MTGSRGLLWISACLCSATVGLASAETVTYTYSGNFLYDDDLESIPVSLGASQDVTITTTSFAAGGFAPVLSFFDPAGMLIAFDVDGNSGGCTVSDPVSNYCWDDYIGLSGLAPGVYTLALTEDNNTPNGPTLADGFFWGTGLSNDFTGPEFLGEPGSFILADGSQRSSAWALQIQITDVVPEPSAAPVCALLLAMAAGRLRTKGRAQ